jgi:hypothetical protein
MCEFLFLVSFRKSARFQQEVSGVFNHKQKMIEIHLGVGYIFTTENTENLEETKLVLFQRADRISVGQRHRAGPGDGYPGARIEKRA